MKQKTLVELLNDRFREIPDNNIYFHYRSNSSTVHAFWACPVRLVTNSNMYANLFILLILVLQNYNQGSK